MFHFPGGVGRVVKHLARFAVPLFFMISGYYAFDYEDYDSFVFRVKKILKILIPGMIVYFIYNMQLNMKEGVELNSFLRSLISRTNLEQILIYGYPAAYTWVGHLWYLIALIQVYAFYMLKRNMKAIVPCLLLGVVFFTELRAFLLDINISTIYYRNAWFTGIPLFYMGYLLKGEQLRNFLCTKYRINIILISSLALMVLEYFLCPGLEIYLSSIMLAFGLLVYGIYNPNLKFLDYIGRRYSQYIYVYHYIVHFVLIWLMNKYITNDLLYRYIRMVYPIIIFFLLAVLLRIAESLNTSFMSKITKRN